MHQLAQLKAKDQRVILSTNIRAVLPLILMSLAYVFTSPPTASAQCDWTFYADSVTVVILGGIYEGRAKETGRWYRDASMEHVDADGTKYIYGMRDGITSPNPMRITRDGLMFYPLDTLPTFRLCDTIGSLYMSSFFEGNSTLDISARYMHYLGLQPYYVLGQTRLCKVFIEYDVWYRDTITERDTSIAVDFYVWDIDANGKTEIVIPLMFHVLADSLGKVDEIDYHHQWVHRNTVIGIWFGSRFVGDPLVGVHEENESTSFSLRLFQNSISLSNIAEADIGTTATIQLYDLYGRLLITEQAQLFTNAAYPVLPGLVATGDVCAWVVLHSNGRVTRGLAVVE